MSKGDIKVKDIVIKEANYDWIKSDKYHASKKLLNGVNLPLV